MVSILTVDFGSTYTKLTAIDIEQEIILGTSKSFTTIADDIQIGYNKALQDLEAQIGKLEYLNKFASSSAAGGLRMIACGLVPELTVKAAKMAVCSAGAKIIHTFAYEMSNSEKEIIAKESPDIILLCGGTDGGNKATILANAKTLAEIPQELVVIVAGNKSVADEVADILKKGNKIPIISENVMPEFNVLNIEPTKKVIRDLFIERIIHAKGLDKAQEIMSDQIIPTPLAVFNGIELLSKGTKTEKGWGDIGAIDVGGATTDVYSMTEGHPNNSAVLVRGLKEPFAKRSVEGDIGVRYSLLSLIDEATLDIISQNTSLSIENIQNWIDKCISSPDIVPITDEEKRIDSEFAAMSVQISMNRHCGTIEIVFTTNGEVSIQVGKDLSRLQFIIGTGGSIVNSTCPKEIIQRALKSTSDINLLKPLNASIVLDKKYIIGAMGLLSMQYPDIALRIMKKELIKL